MPTDDFATVAPTTKIMLGVHAEREVVTVSELYSRLEPGTEPKDQGEWEMLMWAFDAGMMEQGYRSCMADRSQTML